MIFEDESFLGQTKRLSACPIIFCSCKFNFPLLPLLDLIESDEVRCLDQDVVAIDDVYFVLIPIVILLALLKAKHSLEVSSVQGVNWSNL